jgi:hypothetical protein
MNRVDLLVCWLPWWPYCCRVVLNKTSLSANYREEGRYKIFRGHGEVQIMDSIYAEVCVMRKN